MDAVDYFMFEIEQSFRGQRKTVVLYGSFLDNGKSDFDSCVILEKKSGEDARTISEILSRVHQKYALKLDTDIPYEKKAIFTFSECREVAINPPFKKTEGGYYLDDIPSDLTYLNSEKARSRLLFNILTGKTTVLDGAENISEIQQLAWSKLVDLVCHDANNKILSANEIADYLCRNPRTGSCYKDYLGYPQADYSHLLSRAKSALEDKKNRQ